MQTRTGLVTRKGAPVTLLGPEIKEGDVAPDFAVIDTDLRSRSLDDYAGKTLVLAAVPSLDTPICDMETRRFNQEAIGLGDGVRILTISMDLPFAQKRWCGAAGVENVITLSDHREASFGLAYGVLIQELRLLARAIFVVDAQRVVRHAQIVPEVSSEPDFDGPLAVVRTLLG